MVSRTKAGQSSCAVALTIYYVYFVVIFAIWLILFAPVVFLMSLNIVDYLKEAYPECTIYGTHHGLSTAWIAIGLYILWFNTGLTLASYALLKYLGHCSKRLAYISTACIILTLLSIPRWQALTELAIGLNQYCSYRM
jgi:hypothetical protein